MINMNIKEMLLTKEGFVQFLDKIMEKKDDCSIIYSDALVRLDGTHVFFISPKHIPINIRINFKLDNINPTVFLRANMYGNDEEIYFKYPINVIKTFFNLRQKVDENDPLKIQYNKLFEFVKEKKEKTSRKPTKNFRCIAEIC